MATRRARFWSTAFVVVLVAASGAYLYYHYSRPWFPNEPERDARENTGGPMDPSPKPTVPAWAKVAPEQIAEAEKHGVPVAFENDLGMRFVLIPAGTFLMGSPEDEEGRNDDETQHEVTISKPYYMQITEVTLGQAHAWKEEFGYSIYTDDDSYPVGGIDIWEIWEYARWLSAREGREYRLPTNAEWEYACRAGMQTVYWSGNTIADLKRAGWVEVNSDLPPHPVKQKAASPWGLYDMHGNVREICWDELTAAEEVELQGLWGDLWEWDWLTERGGSTTSHPRDARSASRWVGTSGSHDLVGFRLASPLPSPGERGR